MFKLLVLLFVCVALAAGDHRRRPASFDIGIHTQGKSQLIHTAPARYGMTHETFYDYGILTASLKDDTVTWIDSDCNVNTTSRLVNGYMLGILDRAVVEFGARSTNVVYLGRDNQYTIQNANVTIYGAGISDPAAPSLQGTFFRVFINDEFITFIHNDGQVEMKPVACLNRGERSLYDRMKLQKKVFVSKFE